MSKTIDNATGAPTSMQAIAAMEGQTPIAAMGSGQGALVGQTGLAAALARAEIDQQVATARALPRSIATVGGKIHSLVMLDDETAAECVYALPRGGKPIRGPSVRFAEIIASQWGNCRIGARVVHIDRVEKIIQAEGVFHDLETNTAVTMRVNRRISDKHGKLFNPDMIAMTGNAACSIAKRNAILGGVPKAVWRAAFYAAEGIIAGDVETLIERRDKVVKAFAAWGVTPDQIAIYLDLASIEEVSLDDIATLRATFTSIKDDGEDVDAIFPPIKGKKPRKPANIDKKMDESAKGKTSSKKASENKPASTKSDDRDKEQTKDSPQSGNASGDPKTAPKKEAAGDDKKPAASNEAKVDVNPLDQAMERGTIAAERKISRRAIPPEYKAADAADQKAAWLDAYDVRTEELNNG